jgi:hypothetical protein
MGQTEKKIVKIKKRDGCKWGRRICKNEKKVRRKCEGVNEERDGTKKISTARRSLGIEIGIAYPLSFSNPLHPPPRPPYIHTIPPPIPSLFLRICFFLFLPFLLFLSFFVD